MPHPLLPRRPAKDRALAGVGHQDTAHDLDGRRFARSVRADVADQLALADPEADAVKRLHKAHIARKSAFENAPSALGPLIDLEAFADVIEFNLHAFPSLSQRTG